VSLAALFSVLTLAFAAIGVWTVEAGRWPIAGAAFALAVWMGTFAWSALRKTRA
jgi:hypothetical protein